MQLGLKQGNTEEGDAPTKGKGRGKGRGGKGRGRGRGTPAESSKDKAETGDTENAEKDEPKPKKRTRATTSEAPKAKAKATSKSKAKRAQRDVEPSEVAENSGASGSRDGAPAVSGDVAPAAASVPMAASADAVAAAPKRRRRGKTPAPVAPAPDADMNPPEVSREPVPLGEPAGPDQGVVAEVPAQPVPDPIAEAGGLPVADIANDPDAVMDDHGLDGESVAKIRAWKRDPQMWHTLGHLFSGLYAEPTPKTLPKLSYYTISMYWKTWRVGLVQKPRNNILSFGSCRTKRIGLPLAAVDDYVPRIYLGAIHDTSGAMVTVFQLCFNSLFKDYSNLKRLLKVRVIKSVCYPTLGSIYMIRCTIACIPIIFNICEILIF